MNTHLTNYQQKKKKTILEHVQTSIYIKCGSIMQIEINQEAHLSSTESTYILHEQYEPLDQAAEILSGKKCKYLKIFVLLVVRT